MSEQLSVFLSPHLTGKRFNDHLMPLNLLEDFAALEKLIQSVAKKIYLNDHPSRKNAPNEFNNGVSLKLASIDEGSAILKILLVASTLLTEPQRASSTTEKYFRLAKEEIYGAIDAANKNEQIVSEFIDKEDLLSFKKIGSKLRDDESIDFTPGSQVYTAVLNRNIRERILEASVHNYIPVEAKVRASVSSFNKEKGYFTLTIVGGGRLEIETSLSPKFFSIIKDSFDKYEKGQRILIDGTFRFNKSDKPDFCAGISDVSILDPLDVPSRLWDLSFVKNGWFDGEQGIGIDRRRAIKLGRLFDENYDSNIQLPYIYPTIEGGIQAEWSTDIYEISLEVSLDTLESSYHEYNVQTKESVEKQFDLNNESNWTELNLHLIRAITLS